jgi:hypothetical protein
MLPAHQKPDSAPLGTQQSGGFYRPITAGNG